MRLNVGGQRQFIIIIIATRKSRRIELDGAAELWRRWIWILGPLLLLGQSHVQSGGWMDWGEGGGGLEDTSYLVDRISEWPPRRKNKKTEVEEK